MEIRRTGKPATVEHLHFAADGTPQHVEVQAYPIIGATGDVTHVTEYAITSLIAGASNKSCATTRRA